MKKIVFYALADKIINNPTIGYPAHVITTAQKIAYGKDEIETITNVYRRTKRKHTVTYKDVQSTLYQLAVIGLVSYNKTCNGTYFKITEKGWNVLKSEVAKDKETIKN